MFPPSVGNYRFFGIHHNNQLNAFNLADDLIEPFRAMVDMAAHACGGANTLLSKAERRQMAYVLHNACLVEGIKLNIMAAINIMREGLKRIIPEDSPEKLKLPVILSLESLEGITE